MNELNAQLAEACKNENFCRVRRLIKKGADPDTVVNDNGYSAFNYMAWYCKNMILKRMIKAGADLTQRETEYGLTPFLSACTSGCTKTAELLLNAGSDVNEVSNDKTNGLMYAVNNGFINMVRFMTDMGLDINSQNEKGQNALIYAVAKEKDMFSFNREEDLQLQLDMIKELLKYGADINQRDAFGNTALTHAVYRGNIDVVRLLLENNADINAPEKNIILSIEDIPSMVSVDEDELTSLLKSHGAELTSYFARYKINVNCTECGKLIALNGPYQILKCDFCLNENRLENEFWSDIFEESYSEWSRDDTFNVEYEFCSPRCSECGNELDTAAIAESESKINCQKCGHENTNFPAPEWFTKIERHGLKPARIICGEREHGTAKKRYNKVKPIAFQCISCGAALTIDEDTPRNCTCSHCGTVQYLPDPLWKAIHPVKKRKDWYIYFSQ